jgi:hypothetical protein
VLATGGASGHGAYFDTAELYDPATGGWSPTAHMASVRAGHSATLLPSGQVLVAGGRDETSYFATSELYTP